MTDARIDRVADLLVQARRELSRVSVTAICVHASKVGLELEDVTLDVMLAITGSAAPVWGLGSDVMNADWGAVAVRALEKGSPF